jgi:uncharacterized protein (DUF4415 family)
MANHKPLTDEEGEVRDLKAEDFKHFRPAAEVLSPTLLAKLATRRRGPQKAPTKERITIRLSREVVEQFRATGEGWQTRLDVALQDWLKTHCPV